MRLTCLLVEHLAARIETLLDPRLTGKPIVIVRGWADRVIDVTAEASATGIRTGDSRQRAEQLCPQAAILTAREELYQAYHDQLRLVLLNFTNAVETADLGELLIEVSALARAFPSEADLALQILSQVETATHLQPTIGIASNKFTARQAARQCLAQVGRVIIVPDGHERRFLEPLPLSALPDLPAEMSRRLYWFGITTLGGFAQLPRAAVTLQFGSEWAVYHDLARGIDPQPLIPQLPPLLISRTLKLSEPLRDRAMVLAAVERLATRLAQRLDEAGYHALTLALRVTTADDHEQVTGAPVKPPTASVEQLQRLADRLLGRLTFKSEVIDLTLTAYPLREWHQSARQLTLFDAPLQASLVHLQAAIKVLKQRFGEAVIRLASLIGPPLPLPIKVDTRADRFPVRLSWGGWSRRVKTVWNCWREQGTWWDRPLLRDYYQVETDNGVTYTLFCDDQQRWFLDRRRG